MLREKAFGRRTLLSLSIAAGLGTTPRVFAQGDAGVEEITITGTRIRRSDYTSPTPTTTVDGEYLRDLGLVNVGEALIQNPTNVSRFQAATTGSGSFFVGTTMANLRGLNPYFGTRTLTLVDSMRHVPTNQGGSVDLNFIPSVIIDRMETVTGGASASYGSDAVTGVVNILLDKDFEGFRLESDYGATGDGDADNRGVGIARARSSSAAAATSSSATSSKTRTASTTASRPATGAATAAASSSTRRPGISTTDTPATFVADHRRPAAQHHRDGFAQRHDTERSLVRPARRRDALSIQRRRHGAGSVRRGPVLASADGAQRDRRRRPLRLTTVKR